jgi:predicted GNAT family N-acyltransferase
LLKQSQDYSKEAIARTHLIKNGEEKIIAYFSLFNDALTVEDAGFSSKSKKKSFLSRLIPHHKRHLENYPAIKIGRLAVCVEFQGKQIGQKILSYIISLGIELNKSVACKFILVDSYPQSVQFYKRNNFEQVGDVQATPTTPLPMYLDLTPYLNALIGESSE